jgi:hypothetical protein
MGKPMTTRNRTILRSRETTVTHDEYAFNLVTRFLEMSVLLGGRYTLPFQLSSPTALLGNRRQPTRNYYYFFYKWITSYKVLFTFTFLAEVFFNSIAIFPSRISKWTCQDSCIQVWSVVMLRRSRDGLHATPLQIQTSFCKDRHHRTVYSPTY